MWLDHLAVQLRQGLDGVRGELDAGEFENAGQSEPALTRFTLSELVEFGRWPATTNLFGIPLAVSSIGRLGSRLGVNLSAGPVGPLTADRRGRGPRSTSMLLGLTYQEQFQPVISPLRAVLECLARRLRRGGYARDTTR